MESFTLDVVAIEDGCTNFGTDIICIDRPQAKQRTWKDAELISFCKNTFLTFLAIIVVNKCSVDILRVLPIDVFILKFSNSRFPIFLSQILTPFLNIDVFWKQPSN